MLSFSQEDKALITEIIDDIKTLIEAEMHDPESMKISEKYSMPVSELAAQFNNPVLGNLFKSAFDFHGMSAILALWTLAWMGSGGAGYPIGGSGPFAKSIEERYLTLGGTISYKSRIDKILVENDTAVGVRLVDGTKKRGDIVLSAADGFSTIFKWLDGKYSNDTIKGFYETLEPFPPLVFVSLGINGDYSHEPHWLWFSLKTPIEIGGEEIQRLWLRNHSMDKTLAPEGKTVFSVMIPASYDYWAQLEDKQEEYLVEKKED